MAQTTSSIADADAAHRAKKRKSFSIGVAGAIVFAIIIGECAAAYLLLAVGHPIGKAAARRIVADQHVQAGDVDLGKFSLTALDPNSSGSLLIEFHLVGSVDATHAANTAEDAKTAFETLFQPEKSRFRDQVIVFISSAQISLLADPALGSMEKQILARTNSLLGEPLLKDIRFSDFAVTEQ